MNDFTTWGGAPAPRGAPFNPPPGRRRPARSVARLIERALLAFGLAALTAGGAAQVWAALYQCVQSQRLEQERLLPRLDARSRRTADRRLVGRIEVPRLGLSAIIREGTDGQTLLIAVGHVPGTAFPGEDGNVVVSGHRDTFFRALRRIHVSDPIRIVTRDAVYHYRVGETRVTTPDRTDILDPTEEPTLTLITCYPFDFIGPAPKRFVVRARQIDRGESLG